MNQYGRLALRHCRQDRPEMVAAIEDPERFFTEVGQEIEAMVVQIRDDLLGSVHPDEDLQSFRRRSAQAHATAVELVLADHHLFQPTQETEEDDPAMGRYLAELERINKEFRQPED